MGATSPAHDRNPAVTDHVLLWCVQTMFRLYFNIWQFLPKGDQIIWAWSIVVCFLWTKPKLVWIDPAEFPKAPKLIYQFSISAWAFFTPFWLPLLKKEVFILLGLTTNAVLYSHKSQNIMGWKGPTHFKVTPEEVYPSSVFSCSWVNVLIPFVKFWGSADPLLS